jgi:hypothetical protein
VVLTVHDRLLNIAQTSADYTPAPQPSLQNATFMSKIYATVPRTLFLLILLLVPAWGQHDGDLPPLPPSGRLIDIGGWRLHLSCTGQSRASQPTVILESGIGDFSVEWSLVQPGVSQFARVCSYDRAGDGWSEMGPHPRTFHQIVYELHTLLDKAGVKPPFVLVGHSYGGWLVRQYQSVYPSEVAAIVLVEAGAPHHAEREIGLCPRSRDRQADSRD